MVRIDSQPTVMRTAAWEDYGLIDSGEGRKLERFAGVRVVRPEPQCLWRPALAAADWEAADAVFEASDEDEAGRWRSAAPLPAAWPMRWRELTFLARATAFRHLGVFPEQAANWAWIADRIAGRSPFKLLNLFGYTGVASLAAAAAGAAVTHVDASKKAIAWGKENAAAAQLSAAPIRWLAEDARAWVARETRRGALYDGIVLDPPKYGRGPKGEVWRLLDDLPALATACERLIGEGPGAFLLVNAYAERISGVALAGLLAQAMAGRGGEVAWGELALTEEAGGRGIGLSFFARWTAA